MTYPTCILCDIQGPQVRMGLVEWADPQLWGKRFQALTVCTDRRECRQRVEQRGEPWPLADNSAKVPA